MKHRYRSFKGPMTRRERLERIDQKAAARLDDMAADGVTVAMVEIEALRADLEALAEAAEDMANRPTAKGPQIALRKALARDGVKAVLEGVKDG